MKKGKKEVGKIAYVLAVVALCDCGCGGRCKGEACRCNKKDENREEGEGFEEESEK